ncbi:MAG: molybdopterin-dependent oxidoreductase [Pirellulales bacterium]|nr:molybdopterin-dependent oxidoreductase [Pirellulales bacterium]
MMTRVTIDNRVLELDPEDRLNGIEAAARLGIEIPHYCWHPGLSVVGSCRMCLVEHGTIDRAKGHVVMMPKLVPACQTPATDGSVFITNSPKVVQARAMVEEGLLLRHPVDCPICDKAGECFLQDYHFRHGQDARRADARPFVSRRRELGPDITLFVDRCILCSRCVRFVREVSGSSELMVTGRGSHEEIDVLADFPLNNNLSGNVVDLCPVGALCDKHFLYRQRVWFMRSHEGVCAGCATGCSIWIDENQDRVHRIRPRENPKVNRWWICNDGRWSYPHVHNPSRLATPLRREGGATVAVDWSKLVRELDGRLRHAGPLAAVVSPFLTVEEAYLLCRYIRSIDPEAILALGPVPTVGEDERFPGGFVISAEKCPNRRGVERILAHFAGRVASFDEVVSRAHQGGVGGAWVSGGYRRPWIDASAAEQLARAGLLVVQDLFDSPLAERAGYVLPGAAFVERDGSYVNRDGLLQSARRAIRPPSGARTEGSLLWELSGRSGLYQAEVVLQEVFREIEMKEPRMNTDEHG